jgi:Flp pilus assembly pilin Flp
MTPLRSLIRDNRGAALIELAIIAPVFTAMTLGMVVIGTSYSAKLQLEQAAQRTIEKAQQTQVDDTMIATLQAEGAAAAGVDPAAVTVDYWLECNDVRQDDYDSVCPAGDTFARYLTVDIQKSFTPMFNLHLTGSQPDGSYILHGKAGIRTQ